MTNPPSSWSEKAAKTVVMALLLCFLVVVASCTVAVVDAAYDAVKENNHE